jgi:hypothetical protein
MTTRERQSLGRLFPEFRNPHKSNGTAYTGEPVRLGKPLSVILKFNPDLQHNAMFRNHIVLTIPQPKTNCKTDYEGYFHDIERFKTISTTFKDMLVKAVILIEEEGDELQWYFDMFIEQYLKPRAEACKEQIRYMTEEDYLFEQADMTENEQFRTIENGVCTTHQFGE